MLNLQTMLAYQATDGKILKIEKELAATEERKKYVQARGFLKKAQPTLDAYENKAIALKEELKRLVSSYESLIEDLKDFTEIDYDNLSDNEEEVAYLKKNALSMEDSLKSLRRDVADCKAKIEEVSKKYRELKKQTIAAQKQFKEYKEKYAAVEGARSSEMEAIRAELAQMEKELPPEMLERYRNKRKEGVWPVVCELKGNNCPVCMMEFTVAAISRIAADGVIECENCHRLVYKP